MILLLILVFILLLLNPNIVSICVISTCKIWLYKLVPILYPSFILVDFLVKDNYLEMMSVFFFPFFKKILHIRYPKSSLIILLSLISGAPASTKLIKNALDKEDIDSKEANLLLYSCSCFSLPYTIYILNLFHLNSILYYTIILLFIFITFIFNKKESNSSEPKFLKKQNKYVTTFFSSVSNNINILTSILGIMIFFNILLVLSHMDERIYSFFEVLNGHQLLLQLDINKKLKDVLLVSSLSFLGLSVHLQILYIYPCLKYIKFFSYKLLQSLCCGFIFFIFVFFF